jgi:predicted MPP superfamily phosphohydrolase
MNRRIFLKLGLAVAASVVPAGTLLAVQSTELEISHQRVSLPGLGRRLRIVAISDLHGRSNYLDIKEIISIVNGYQPDIFILAGDIIDRPKDLGLISEFAAVKARFLKAAVMGNWEYQTGLGVEAFKSAYDAAGVHLIVNSNLNIQNLSFFGLDDLLDGRPDFQKLNVVLSEGRPLLLISHCPAGFDHIRQGLRTPVVAISGHTHGGQIAPFGNAIITPHGSGDYVHGWYRRGDASMYVTRGIGTSGIPIRIGARPEMVVMDLEEDRG